MLTAARPTAILATTDSHDNGISGVLIDDVVVDVLGEVSVSELVVAELCSEMA
jgi:hypothetical protein